MKSMVAGFSPEKLQSFLNGPAASPPAPNQLNLHNPESLSDEFIVLCTVAATISGLGVAMRLYTRWKLTRKLIVEDFILTTGWILFAAGVNTTIYQATAYKLGAHQWNVRVKEFVQQLKLFHYGTLLFCVCMLLLRIAIIMQVLRHFVPKGARNFTFWASHALIAANTVFWLAITLMEIFSCRPRKHLWEFYGEGECIDRHAYMIASAAMNLGSEILIMLLPQRVIWKLSLSTKQKLELTPLFLVGTLTCICSAIRLWQQIVQYGTPDMSYYLADAVMLWTIPEIACSVLVPCLPSLPQFIRIMQRKAAASRPASTVFQLGGGIAISPRRTNKSWSNREPKTMRTIVSDVEYHELVMRTETTIDIMERDDREPWIQTPATVHIQGGNGPTKVFSTPTYFRDDLGPR